VEKCITNVETNPRGTMSSRKRQCLPHAAQVVVLGLAVRHIVETIKCVTIVASQIGLRLNASKTIYTINRKKNENASKEIEIGIRKC
jgi:hypothetical protein